MESRIKLKIIIFLSSILILFCIGELTIRVSDAVRGCSFFSNEQRDKLIIKNNPIIPFRTFGPNYYKEKNGIQYIASTHEELYPLIKPANTFRIVCFGGSTTENPFEYKAYKLHYPLILQKLLREVNPRKNIEVINVGYSLYSTPQLLILLELDVVSWNPDLVIISENVNDLDVAYWKDYKLDYSNKYSSKHTIIPDYYNNYTTMNALFRWSSFYWFLEDKIELISNKFFNHASGEITKISYGNEPPKISQYVFRRNLLNFYYIANKWGIDVLFATQPLNSITGSFGYLMWDDELKNVKLPLDPERKLHHKFFNSIIKEVAVSTNSYFLDNDSLFNGDPKYFIDEVHYTKEGIEKLANNYRDYIVSKKIIK